MRNSTLQLVGLAVSTKASRKPPRPGPAGLPPEHQINGRRIRFRNPDGSWGEWINLAEVTVSRGGVTESRVLTLIQEQGSVSYDDYAQSDTQPGQSGPGVKRFTFDAEVQLVKVHPRSTDADALAWAASDTDLTPADGTGDPCPANQDTHLFGNRSYIDIYLPDGMTGYVTGYRRTAV